MELLSLELNENEIKEIINNIKIITNIDESDVNIELSSTTEGNIKIRYFTNEDTCKKDYLEKIVAKITKLLIEYTKHESINYLKENYFYFEEEEFDSIADTIKDEIDNDIKIQLVIKNKFREVLENTNTINLNGFVQFRLKFIKLYVSQIVEKCIDSYLMKKEYLDFIGIIKLITEADEKEYDIVNIFYNNNKLQVYDNNMKKLTLISNVEVSKELEGKIIAYDESVINILLNISPKKIKLHTAKADIQDIESKNTIEIIKRIFEDRIEICKGCKYCDLN